MDSPGDDTGDRDGSMARPDPGRGDNGNELSHKYQGPGERAWGGVNVEMTSGEMSGSSPPLRNNHVRVVYPPVVSLPGGGPPLGSLFGRES